ncbi:MAG: DUF1592 domain-containing protein [Planctomycetia bacterium]|nr:DUF1592 domain-containing protein [Planctomycetia bacterium]
MLRVTLSILFGTSFALVAGAATVEPVRARMQPVHADFLKSNCVDCHNADDANGGVRLDDIPLEIGEIAAAERWQKVLGVLNSGEMPPDDAPQPPDDDKASFLEVLSKQMVVARKALADAGGAITMRRLNRREYVNTIRELLDVEVNPRDLPADDDGGTFDTIGSALFFSSDQFEQYRKLARAALNEAIVADKAKAKPKDAAKRPERKIVRREVEEDVNKRTEKELEEARAAIAKAEEWHASGKPPKEFGFNDESHGNTIERVARGKEVSLLAYKEDPATATGVFTKTGQEVIQIPGNTPPGKYLVRVRVGFPPDAIHCSTVAMTPLLPPKPESARFIELGTQGDNGWPSEMKLLGCRRVTGTIEQPEVIEFPVTITKEGSHILGVRERRCNGDAEVAGLVNFYWHKQQGLNKHVGFYRSLWVDWVEWEGPLVEQWPPRSHELVLGGIDMGAKPDESEARGVIERFAERAFRGRPAKPAYVDRLVGHYAERRAAGEPFVEAIKTPLSLMLASPSFLYIAEPVRRGGPAVSKPPAEGMAGAEGNERVPLTDVELANRLSYFLWSSPPDDRLMALARSGSLREPKVLAAEVDRMLADEKVERFISGFTHQWLHMVRLDFFQFNHRLYPTFDGSVKAAARREVYETIRTVLDENLPLGTLLKSDFVVINDLLADYYDIPGVEGVEFRRVAVPQGLPRGGLLGMAAILAMGSDGERSSPVERGVWVLQKLLHDPPPPAPANVPQLSRFAGTLMPARKLMTSHQEQPQCAQCHRRIDPIGYGLEHFDAAGRWREQEYTDISGHPKAVKKKEFFPIDATGQLPDGTAFDGFEGLRDAVAGHEADFARGMVEHLVEYALGRPCGFSDEELVETILDAAKPSRYTPRALIQAIVASKEFESK